MKFGILTLSLALITAPTLAAAQQPAPNDAPARAAKMQIMRQMRELHEQARIAMLDSLSPASRNLLAAIAGELAVSERPDVRAAEARLDAGLSTPEKNAIFAAENNLRQQSQALREQMAPEMNGENGPPPDHPGMMRRGGGGTPVRSAGRALLQMVRMGPMGPPPQGI